MVGPCQIRWATGPTQNAGMQASEFTITARHIALWTSRSILHELPSIRLSLTQEWIGLE
jgi:hypothetical protein